MSVTVINPTPVKIQPVPEVGKTYHIFDDGKLNPNRLYTARILEVIPTDKVDPLVYKAWKCEKDIADWLYATDTDYFVKANSNFDDNPLHFVRTIDGGWFSIDYPDDWMGARLDIDGSLYNMMKEIYK